MVRILDSAGQFLEETTQHGYVRRLLKDNKAKVVMKEPFTIQLNEDTNMNKAIQDISIENILMFNLELLCGKLDTKTKKAMETLIHSFLYQYIGETVTMYDVINYLKINANTDKVNELSNALIDTHGEDLTKISFDLSVPAEVTELPKYAYLKPTVDKHWNIVPIGEMINEKDGQLKPIGWYLNDREIDDDIYDTVPSTSLLISGCVGYGTSIVMKSIINHVKNYSDKFQLIGADCTGSNFSKNDFNVLVQDPDTIAETSALIQNIMMRRFRTMSEAGINNIWNISNRDFNVPYYSISKGEPIQFDELFAVNIGTDLDPKIKVMTIEMIYNCLEKKEYEKVNILGTTIGFDDIVKTERPFICKAIVLMVKDIGYMTHCENSTAINTFIQAIGSIARLGRAAGIHLVLSCQRTKIDIPTDIKNNIQMVIGFGGIDEQESVCIFGKDITNITHPAIKGRVFIGSGNEIIETQIYEGIVNNF